MQLSVFDRGAARKLKPLTTSVGVSQSSADLQADMLDRTPSPNPPIAFTQSSSSSSSQTDVDLFSDEDDDASRSMLDELEFLELSVKDEAEFADLFDGFDKLDKEEDWDKFYEDEMLEEYHVTQEDDMTLL